jgi:hypothetical protein
MAYFLDPGFHPAPDQIYFSITVATPMKHVHAGLPVPKDAMGSREQLYA